jgi:hypothetical protein
MPCSLHSTLVFCSSIAVRWSSRAGATQVQPWQQRERSCALSADSRAPLRGPWHQYSPQRRFGPRLRRSLRPCRWASKTVATAAGNTGSGSDCRWRAACAYSPLSTPW